ncbi:hypothetical protein SDC9_45282 [bioreactor metagenome]|uniref:Uncharacterized protein n=1 Tax=bioreactor metagenome TaxID=1076179 RepID=A0A644W660_9ZZZZ
MLQDEVLLNQRHPTPHLHNLPHHIRKTDHPAIHPRRCILPIPTLCRVGSFEDHLPPAIVDHHAEHTHSSVINYRTEGVVQAVVVGGEGVGSTYRKVLIVIKITLLLVSGLYRILDT